MDIKNLFPAIDVIVKKRIEESRKSNFLIALIKQKKEDGSYLMNFQEVEITGWAIDSNSDYVSNDIVYFMRMPNHKNVILTTVK